LAFWSICCNNEKAILMQTAQFWLFIFSQKC
jgi:hypothetical protein